jgi:hypothetical protein
MTVCVNATTTGITTRYGIDKSKYDGYGLYENVPNVLLLLPSTTATAL